MFQIGHVVMWKDEEGKHCEGFVVGKHEGDMYTVEVVFKGEVVKDVIEKVSGDKLKVYIK